LNSSGSSISLAVNDFSLERLKGRIHLPIAKWVDVEWKHVGADEISYSLTNSNEFVLYKDNERLILKPGTHKFMLRRVAGQDRFL
jgi:hypothetical protein